MTRVVVYAALMVVSIAGNHPSLPHLHHHGPPLRAPSPTNTAPPATVMTIASIYLPNWITYSVTTPSNNRLTQHIGLHRSCSNFRDPPCRPYPSEAQCEGDEAVFCRMWRSAGFIANFAVALHLVMVVVYIVLINGGKQRREGGWRLLAGLLAMIAMVEYAIVAVIVSSFPPYRARRSSWGNIKRRSTNRMRSPISMTTTTSSASPAGRSTPPGCSARLVLRFPPPALSPSRPPTTSCLRRAATTTSPTPTRSPCLRLLGGATRFFLRSV